MRKPVCGICENTGVDQPRRGDRAADPRLCFRFIVRLLAHCIYFINPKLKGSSHLLWLYSPVCVGPGLTTNTGFLTTRLTLLCSLRGLLTSGRRDITMVVFLELHVTC